MRERATLIASLVRRCIRFRSLAAATLVPLALLLPGFAAARPGHARTLWSIGRFDHSSREFHPGAAPLPAPAYVVGRSTYRRDWYAFQPGSHNARYGNRPHPLRIKFELPVKPQGLYTLVISMLVRTHHLSSLALDLNGHHGFVYQRPKWHDTLPHKHWRDRARVELPTYDLHPGMNTLTLTAQDARLAPLRDSGVVYDALALEQDPSRRFAAAGVAATIEPSIFYRREHGRLVELVHVLTVRNEAGRGSVALRINGQTFMRPLPAGLEFGQHRTGFAVPVFTSGTPARVTVRLHGFARQFHVTLKPAKKWVIYIVPHEHLDVGYTDYQSKVAEIHSRVFDETLRMMRQNPRFRYSPDGFWEVRQFLAGRSAADRARLLRAIEARRFFIPAQYANLLTGFPTLETLIRSLYPSFRFAQRYHLPFDYANDTDVPSYSWSYASILAASGLHMFFAGSDQTRGPILEQSHLEERSPFWWEGPDGAKVLTWYSYSYGQVGALFGLPPRVGTGAQMLPRFLQVYRDRYYKPHAMLLYGAQWENSDLYPQQATIVPAWNRIYAYPRLRYSGFAHALAAIAKQEGGSIPVYRGDGGPYWEDGIASDARYAAMNRESEQRALSAEKIATISSLINPRTRPDRHALRRMWRHLILFDEHTWGAAGSVSNPQSSETRGQLTVKDSYALRAREEMQQILGRGLAALADKIPDLAGTWIVFNPLNWRRSGLVDADLPRDYRILDLATKRSVPYQVLSSTGNLQRVRFLAQDVPSVGYLAFAIRPAAPATRKRPKAPAEADSRIRNDVMENGFYRVSLDPGSGAIRSIYDKQLGRELVNTASRYRFDQYLYVTGGDRPARNSLIFSDRGLPRPRLSIHAAVKGRLLSIQRAPFGLVARMESSAVNTPRIDTEIILFNHEKRIEFINHVFKKPVTAKEGVYFAFPLAMSQPRFRYEIQNGYVNPARDQLPGAGKEWFSVQHWVEARQGGLSVALVPLDASLVTLGDIVRGEWPLHFGHRPGTIFSYVMNNYWFTNYRASQGGNFTFRYLLTDGRRLQPAALSRLGWSAMTPLERDAIIPNDKVVNPPEPLPAAEAGFLQVRGSHIILVAWKRAMNRQGTILRFLNAGNSKGVVAVRLSPMRVQRAWQCNAMEQDRHRLPVTRHGFSFRVHPFEIVTVRIEAAMPRQQPSRRPARSRATASNR